MTDMTIMTFTHMIQHILVNAHVHPFPLSLFVITTSEG
jgi:hypothetical protein